MRDFEAGDIVRVPFPYTDRATRQHRPALVVSKGRVGKAGALLWVVMITSAENHGWPDDIPLPEPAGETGLPIPSIVRTAKIATIEAAKAGRIGRVSPEIAAVVSRALRRSIAA